MEMRGRYGDDKNIWRGWEGMEMRGRYGDERKV